MEPTAVVPMTWQSPSFWLTGFAIVALAGVFWMAFSTVAKSNAADSGPYDPARTLTNTALIMLSLVFVYLSGIVAYQVYTSPNGAATTEAWGQLCLFIGWVLGTATGIYNNRFGTTKQSESKDAVIAQQARTGAVQLDALLDPKVVVTGTGDGNAMARAAIDPAATPAVPGAPIQTGTMNVTATGDVNVTEEPKKD